MHIPVAVVSSIATLLVQPQVVSAHNFLRAGAVTEQSVRRALFEELDVADHLSSMSPEVQARLTDIEDTLKTMFESLPKNEKGNLNHLAARYALHRHFAHRYGWWFSGMEPSRETEQETQDPEAHSSSSMKDWVPSYMQDHFEAALGHKGSDLQHLSAMGLALRDLVAQEVKARLETVYSMHERSPEENMTLDAAKEVISTYFVAFVNGGYFVANNREEVKRKQASFEKSYARWDLMKSWMDNLWEQRMTGQESVSFQQMLTVAMAFGEEYVKFNEDDCSDLKSSLRGLKGGKAGRVRLSAFYLAGMHTHFTFNEKQEYLRNLGALDESDPKNPAVIISNYAMSRSNCLEASNLYTICCKNHCEDLMIQLESKVNGPTASVEYLLSVLPTLQSDSVPALGAIPDALVARLQEIAKMHDGVVPLHGRLFAQWMHHAYPFECPFPHEVTVNPMTGDEWMRETGNTETAASPEEIQAQVDSDTCAIDAQGQVECGDAGTMDLPWNSKEQLLTWSPQNTRAEQPSNLAFRACAMVATVLLVLGLVSQSSVNAKLQMVAAMRNPIAVSSLLAGGAYGVGLLDLQLFICTLFVAAAAAASRIYKKKGGKGGLLPSHKTAKSFV